MEQQKFDLSRNLFGSPWTFSDFSFFEMSVPGLITQGWWNRSYFWSQKHLKICGRQISKYFKSRHLLQLKALLQGKKVPSREPRGKHFIIKPSSSWSSLGELKSAFWHQRGTLLKNIPAESAGKSTLTNLGYIITLEITPENVMK